MRTAPIAQNLLAALLLSALVGCGGRIMNGKGGFNFDGGFGAIVAHCDPAQYAGLAYADVATEYAQKLQPLFQDSNTGCASCHGPTSGRLFMVTTDPANDFQTALSQNLIDISPGGVLDRLTTTSAQAHMPKNGPQWSQDNVEKVLDVACKASALPPVDEMFPPNLEQPYTGPAINYYDTTFLNYFQLRGRVEAVFGPDAGADVLTANVASFGGVDFQTQFVETEGATSDYLLALDDLADEVCDAAATAKSGPFAKSNRFVVVDTTAPIGSMGQESGNIQHVYNAMLSRYSSDTETTAAYALLTNPAMAAAPDPWKALCQGLMKSPDFLFTLPPALLTETDPAKKNKLSLVKLALDLLARPPTQAELDQVDATPGSITAMTAKYLDLDGFKKYFFYRMQVRTQSDGSDLGDEPARLWTYLAVTGGPFQDLFVANYTVDKTFKKVLRTGDDLAHHGNTGLLTMAGYLSNKQGLPHFNYSARVLADFMGYVFEVPADVIAMRAGASPSSTVDPSSVCYSCHKLLTLLAYQRSRWQDDGSYVEYDADHNAIDQSDEGMVADYPYAGDGMQAFSTKAVKKEMFIRQMMNAEYLILVGRYMRYDQDERKIYKTLWGQTGAAGTSIKDVVKTITAQSSYLGQ